jgi:hypothetical protein|tara:strand:+ start:1788 stop:1973 length:186 start_codon:yes stop_codon:yes gene_type:complete
MSKITNWIMDMEEDLEDGFTREQMSEKHGSDGVYKYDCYHGRETLNNRKIDNEDRYWTDNF